MSEYQVQVDDADGHTESKPKESPGLGSKSQSKGRLSSNGDGASSRRLSARTASFVALASGGEFANDADREAAHLRDANRSLDEQIAKMKQQIQELRNEGLSNMDRKSLQDIESDNEAVRKEIAVLRGKLGQASNVELLDKLTDELAAREVDLKAVEVRTKNVSDENFLNAKLVRKEDNGISPQAVFLDMKADRRRHMKQLDKTRSRIEKSKEAHAAIAERLRGMEEEEQSLHLNDVSHEDIVNTQKAFEANEKEVDKLRRKLVSFETTITARKMQTARKSQNLCEDITELQAQVRTLEAQVMKLEATIMSNQGLKSKPPHFVQPIEMVAPKPKPMPLDPHAGTMNGTSRSSTTSPRAPQGPPPAAASPRQQQKRPAQVVKPKPVVVTAAPPPKKKEDNVEAAAPPPKPQASSPKEAPRSSSDTRLNDLDDDRTPTPRSPTPTRTPTPPPRTPTPPAARDPHAGTQQPVVAKAETRTPTPPAAGSRPASGRSAPAAEEEEYGEEDFETSPHNNNNNNNDNDDDGGQPAFLTE